MIDHIVGNNPLPANIRQDIIERTDGIPLFVEEMTKAVLEAEREDEARRTAASVPSPASAVPASLARIVDGAARPTRRRQGAGADRGGDRTRVLACPAGCGRVQAGGEAANSSSTVSFGLVCCSGRACRAVRDLLFQACAGTGCGLQPAAARAETCASCPNRRNPRKQVREIAENQPELLARHCTEAGQIEKAAALWGKAGQRSAQRSALVEATEQLRRALDLIATLTGTPALRREEIKLQVALITPLLHVSGYAAPETRAAVERARLLIEQAEALGEPPEDPLLLFSVLYGLWVANLVAFNGDVMRELAVQFLTLAEKQSATGPLMIGHRLMGLSLLHTGDIADGRAHLDRAITLYDPAEHRPLATRFGQDVGAATLSWKSLASWLLGYPQAALADAEHALKIAREIGHSATLMYVLNFSAWTTYPLRQLCEQQTRLSMNLAL